MELEKDLIRNKIKLVCPKCGESWEGDRASYFFMPFFKRGKDNSLICPKCSTLGKKA